MDDSPTNSRAEQMAARQIDEQWEAFSTADRIRWIELEGYVVLPDLLSDEELAAIRKETSRLTTKAVDYSERQRGCSDWEWSQTPRAMQVVANPTATDFLSALFGDELICTSVAYAQSLPGHPGIAIHTDAQPYGSQIFGLAASAPQLVRVLYYLDDLTAERSPFKVIPRSHLSMHADGNPYHRYLSHPDEVMVTCAAGSAVVINQKVFHGNYPNYSDSQRRMLAVAYRPAWAGPVGEVADRDAKRIAKLPENVRGFFGSLNTRRVTYDLPNRPEGMTRHAPGISPRRWNEGE